MKVALHSIFEKPHFHSPPSQNESNLKNSPCMILAIQRGRIACCLKRLMVDELLPEKCGTELTLKAPLHYR